MIAYGNTAAGRAGAGVQVLAPKAPIRRKPCTRCGMVLPLSRFHKDTRSADGHASICSACRNDRNIDLLVSRGYDFRFDTAYMTEGRRARAV